MRKTLFQHLFRESHTRKLLLGVFVGTHLPMIALLGYLLVFVNPVGSLSWQLLGIVLLATVVGFSITVYVLYQLVAPVETASKALQEFVDHSSVPNLPKHHETLAGRLVANVQNTIEHVVELTETLERTALYDYLTGCYTRRAGTTHLLNDIARVKRGEGTFSLALLDIDNFKALNDQYGHAFGDRCLKALTAALTGKLRQGDWIARWGGDEFVLVLWDVDSDSAAEAMMRLTAIIKSNPCYADDGKAARLEVSIGICQFEGNSDQQALLRSADRALYQAKSGDARIIKTALHESP